MSYDRDDLTILDIHVGGNYVVKDAVYIYERLQEFGKYAKGVLPETWEELTSEQQDEYIKNFGHHIRRMIEEVSATEAARHAIDDMTAKTEEEETNE